MEPSSFEAASSSVGSMEAAADKAGAVDNTPYDRRAERSDCAEENDAPQLLPPIKQPDATPAMDKSRQPSLSTRDRFAMPCSETPYDRVNDFTPPHGTGGMDSLHHSIPNDVASQLQAQLAQQGMHILQQLEIISEEAEGASAAESVSRRSSVTINLGSSATAPDAASQLTSSTYEEQQKRNEIESNEYILAVVKQHVHDLSEEDGAAVLPTPLLSHHRGPS